MRKNKSVTSLDSGYFRDKYEATDHVVVQRKRERIVSRDTSLRLAVTMGSLNWSEKAGARGSADSA